MDLRLLDILVGLSGLIFFIVLLIVLPLLMPAGIAYILAIACFLLAMSAAGITINKHIDRKSVV
jgi:hypothetical protein